MDSATDPTLLDAWLRTRCERSFRDLVERRLPMVLAIATRLTRDPDLARDVAQQTFARLAANPPSIGPDRSLAGWLHLTARSLAIDLIRSEEARRRREQYAAMNHEPATAWSDLAAVIDDALAKLPASDREAVMLRFFEGLSHSAVGQRLGLPENSARMRVSRALDKLRLLLGKRGIATTAAALELALPGHAAMPVPAGLAGSISSFSLTKAVTAVTSVSLSIISAALMKKAAVIVLLLAAAAIPVWHYAISRNLHAGALQTGDGSAPGTPAVPVSGPVRDSKLRSAACQSRPAAKGLEFARIEDAAERDAALAAWAAQFTSNDSVLEVIAALRAEPKSTATLRALIAPHLTRQWATVDGAACIAAHLREGGLYQRDPLDSKNNPFAARDSDATTPVANLFSLIAETNPAAFKVWVTSAPADLIPALLGDITCATWQTWRTEAGKIGETVSSPDPSQAENFHQCDFANALAVRHPDLLLRPAQDGRDLGPGRRYYNGLLEKLGADDGFSAALIKSHPPGQLWDIFSKVTGLAADFIEDPRAPFLKLARLELAAAPRSMRDAAAAATDLPADYRQAATFTVLLESLDPSAGATYWEGLNTIAKALNDIAGRTDALEEITRVNFYSDLRAGVATSLAKEDLGEALEWAGSISDQRNRASCLMKIAAQELKPDVKAWASGQVGAEAAEDRIVMHIEDTSADPPLVRQFDLPPAVGESLPEYYARLRAAFKEQLEKAQ